MATYRYPQNDFDRADLLVGLLGSFWSSLYQGEALVEHLASAAGNTAQQTYRQLLALVNSVSRKNIPLYRQNDWHALRILRSELAAANQQYVEYAEVGGISYTANTQWNYGQKALVAGTTKVAKPEKLVTVCAIFNQVLQPTVALSANIDFWLTDTHIVFRENPFDNKRIARREILNAVGEIVDVELTLWLYAGKWDWQDLYKQFGYVLQLHLTTSENYKKFLNAIFDAFTSGTAAKHQQLAITAAFGVPVVIEAEETVECLRRDNTKLNIITDKNVYQFPLTANAIVTPSQTLRAGDFLTDTLQIFELNRGQLPPIDALTLDHGFLAGGYHSGITFENKQVPVTVTPAVAGYTKIEWSLGGFPPDIEKFWQDVHAAGVSTGTTLAMLLDKRKTPVGQPTEASLPSQINPVQFLIENVFRGHVTIVKLRITQQTDKLSFFPLAQYRNIQPPQSALIFVLDLILSDKTILPTTAGTTETPGCAEAVSAFSCLEQTDIINPSNLIVERVRISRLAGRCL